MEKVILMEEINIIVDKLINPVVIHRRTLPKMKKKYILYE